MFIARGGHKTKKTAEVEERLRKALAQGHSARADEVYARRAGLVGIIPMPPDDADEGHAGGDEKDKKEAEENERSTPPNGRITARSDEEWIAQHGGPFP